MLKGLKILFSEELVNILRRATISGCCDLNLDAELQATTTNILDVLS